METFKYESSRRARAKYALTEKGKDAARRARSKYKKSKKGKLAAERYIQQNRIKVVARRRANKHVPNKDATCRCGERAVEKHHPDYRRPLHIVWLCTRCHVNLHKERGMNASISSRKLR